MINTYIKEGKIVPAEVTVRLLHEAMEKSGKTKFLIDGFPRNLENLQVWEKVSTREEEGVGREGGGRRKVVVGDMICCYCCCLLMGTTSTTTTIAIPTTMTTILTPPPPPVLLLLPANVLISLY